MNRTEEYALLLQELDNLPIELESVAERAVKRKKTSQKKRRLLGIPAGSFAACFAGFVLLVNCFPTFAAACGSVPFLKELAEAVCFSPSLSAAVEHEYVQPIGQVQEKNGITAEVQSVIVDRKQVSIFFTLDADFTEHLDFYYKVDAPELEGGFSTSTGSFGMKNGELRRIDVNCVDTDVPDTLHLTLRVYDNAAAWHETEPVPETSIYEKVEEPRYNILAEFTFTLIFDPYFTAQGEVIPVNQIFTMDGQMMTLTEVEVYPTHLRINLDDAPENTAWLKGLDLYLENEHGERFESSVNGISASGDPDGKGYSTFWLDSPFFSQGEKLTLYITGSRWLEKEGSRVRVDLKRREVSGLAENVRFIGAEQHGREWWLSFAAPQEPDGGMYQLFSGHFWDEAGKEYDIMQWGSSIGYRDPATGEYVEEDTMFTDLFPLEGFTGDIAYLEPVFSKAVDLTGAPVCIPIK